jgi:hypothetical protein
MVVVRFSCWNRRTQIVPPEFITITRRDAIVLFLIGMIPVAIGVVVALPALITGNLVAVKKVAGLPIINNLFVFRFLGLAVAIYLREKRLAVLFAVVTLTSSILLSINKFDIALIPQVQRSLSAGSCCFACR